MATHVALLRGINVGGKNRVPMEGLREAVAGLGHRAVATYIQSGNVLFDAADPRAPATSMADELESAIAATFAVRSPVVVLSRAELDAVVGANPFVEAAEAEPRPVHAVLLREAPGAQGEEAVRAAVARARAAGSEDDARLLGRAVYLWTPGGYGRSVLVTELSRGGARSTPARTGTARNWATMRELARLAATG